MLVQTIEISINEPTELEAERYQALVLLFQVWLFQNKLGECTGNGYQLDPVKEEVKSYDTVFEVKYKYSQKIVSRIEQLVDNFKLDKVGLVWTFEHPPHKAEIPLKAQKILEISFYR